MTLWAHSLRQTLSVLALALYSPCPLSSPATPAPSAPGAITSRGLKETTQDRDIAEKAVAMANRIVEPGTYRLDVSWKFAAGGSQAAESIPLYLVAAPPKNATTPAAVPLDCRCIFVNPKTLHGWIKSQSTGSAQLNLEPVALLAFMLLHEVGHLATRTSAVEFVDGEMSQLNVAPSIAKAREEGADDFAALLIRTRAAQQPVSGASLAASQVASELLNLTWNMQARRALDHFASWMTGEPSVYFDPGYSHPNLAWRILRSNHLIHQSEASKDLLDAFEEARERGAHPKPLYEAK